MRNASYYIREKLIPDRALGVYMVLMVLAFSLVVGAVSSVSVFMSGFTGEPVGRIAAKAACYLLLMVIVLYLFQ